MCNMGGMKILFPIIAFLLLGGCASVPMQSKEEDMEAKKFNVSPGLSKIYVYRDETFGSAIKIKLSLDGESMGQTASNVYHVWEVKPGKHVIDCQGESADGIKLMTDPNKAYFVWQEMKMGWGSAGCELHKVEDSVGMKAVSKLKLAKSGPHD